MRPYMYLCSRSPLVGRSLIEYYFGFCEQFTYSMVGSTYIYEAFKYSRKDPTKAKPTKLGNMSLL